MEKNTMSTIKHRYPYSKGRKETADRTTIWLLVVVVVAAFMALTFGDAGGAGLL
jgi:hypothetical protein